MSRNFDIVYPPKGKITLDGGLNTKFERTIIPDNESPDCYNVVFTNGAVATRAGSSKLNTTAIGSFVGDGIAVRRDITGAETMIVFAGGTVWALTGASTFTTIGSAQSIYTAGQRWGTAQYENHLFAGDGGITPYKYNGVAWTRHGVPQATGVVSVASATTSVGQLNGEYRYRIAYINSQSVAGDVGTATVTVTVASAKNILTDIPVAPQSHGVSARRIYRNFASGSTATYGLLTTINDNTTTTYVDNDLDSALGATYDTDQGEPPNYSIVCYHQNRLFCNDTANPNYVWYSDLFEPYTFATTNFLLVGDGSFDLVKGLFVYENGVMVQCERSLTLIYMPSTTPSDWRQIRIRSQYGSKSPFGTFLYNNKAMVPAMENDKFAGFATISGSSLDPAATVLDVATAGGELTSDRIEPNLFTVAEAYVGNISAIVFKNKAYIALTESGSTTNDRVWIFDFSISNLKKQQIASWAPISGINAAQFVVYGGSLYYVSSTANGFVYELEADSYTDVSTAINSYFWTKEFAGVPGHENHDKDFRWANLLVEKEGTWPMTFGWRVDSDLGEGQTKTIDLSPGGSVWGNQNWGDFNWDAGRGQEEVRIPIGPSRGKRIQFKFSNQNTAGQGFKVHWMTFSYNLKGKR